MEIICEFKNSGSIKQSNHYLNEEKQKNVICILRPKEIVHINGDGDFIYNLELMEYCDFKTEEMNAWISYRINYQKRDTILRNVFIQALIELNGEYYQKPHTPFITPVIKAVKKYKIIHFNIPIYGVGNNE